MKILDIIVLIFYKTVTVFGKMILVVLKNAIDPWKRGFK